MIERVSIPFPCFRSYVIIPQEHQNVYGHSDLRSIHWSYALAKFRWSFSGPEQLGVWISTEFSTVSDPHFASQGQLNMSSPVPHPTSVNLETVRLLALLFSCLHHGSLPYGNHFLIPPPHFLNQLVFIWRSQWKSGEYRSVHSVCRRSIPRLPVGTKSTEICRGEENSEVPSSHIRWCSDVWFSNKIKVPFRRLQLASRGTQKLHSISLNLRRPGCNQRSSITGLWSSVSQIHRLQTC